MNEAERSFVGTTLRMSAGVIVWVVHFGVIYGYTGLACARRFSAAGALWLDLVPWVIGTATLVAASLAAYWTVPVLRAGSRLEFSEWMSGWLALLALGAILLEGATVLWVPVCA